MKWWIASWRRWKSRADRIQPTQRQMAVWFALAVAAFASGGIIRPAWLVWTAASAIALALAGYDLATLYRWGLPSLSRQVETRPQIGIDHAVHFVVDLTGLALSVGGQRTARANALREALLQADLYDGVAATCLRIGGLQYLATDTVDTLRFVQTIRALRRGPCTFTDVDLRWRSPWRLWARLHRYDTEETWLVLPDVTSWRKPVLALQQTLLSEGRHVKRLASGNTEFSYIADYTPDDDPRHLNWAATARRARLMKNVYQPERGQHVVIAIDASRYMDVRLPDGKLRLDYAVDCAAALAHTALAVGDSVGLVAFTSEVLLRLPPGRGVAHWQTVVRALAGIEAKSVQGGYQALLQVLSGQFHRRNLLVVLSELEGVAADQQRLLPMLTAFQRRHPTVFVTVSDVQALHRAEAAPESQAQALSLAAAEWVLKDRAATVAGLRQRGIAVVESLPGDVVVAAVREYLVRKRKFTM